MLRINYYSVLLLTLFTLGTAESSKATHFAGADLTYTYSGTPNNFLISLKLYRDCCPTCTAFDPSYQVCYSSVSLGIQGAITCTLPNPGQLIPPSPCVNTPQCYEEYIYNGTVILPQASNDWVFTFNGFARNNAITTLVNPGGQGLAVKAYLDNLNNPTDNSPQFSFIPITRFCVGNQFYFDQGASDPDNDSLVFSLAPAEGDNTQINPQTCPFTNVTNLAYVAPYSPTDPLASVNGITINSQTGLISFVPALQQIAIICVKVEEYRNGVLIGSVKRDIQAVIVAVCNILPVAFDSVQIALGIGASCGDNSVIIAFNGPIQCGSIVPTDIRATDPNGLPNPVISATAINCNNGLTDSILVTFFNPFIAGTTYVFTKIGNDGNTFLSICGTQMPEFDSLEIIVVDPGIYTIAVQDVSCFFTSLTVTFSEEFTCGTIVSNASDFQFVDATGTTIPITSVTSNCNPANQYDYTNQLTFNFATGVMGAGPYYLIANSGSDLNTISNKCGTFFQIGDTLAQLNVINSIIVNLGNDITVCASDPTPVLDAGNPGVHFTWFFNGTQLTNDTLQTLLADTSGQYVVICFFSASCQGVDTINVTINPAPTVNLGPDVTICAGDPLPLPFDAGNTGASYQWYFNGFALAGDTNQTLVPDTSLGSGNYSVTVNTGGNCSGTDNLNFTINALATVNAGPNQTICENATATMAASIGGGASSGTWSTSGSGTFSNNNLNAVYTPSAGDITAGSVTLTYTTDDPAGPCTFASASMTLTIVAAPDVSISGNPGSVACITDLLTATDATGTATSYQWYVDGTLSSITTSTYNITVADGTPHTYMVVVSNGTCSDSAQFVATVYPNAPTPAVSDTAYCSGTAIPPLDAGVTGVSYQWYDNSGNQIAGATNQQYTPTSAGTYSVTVSIAGGLCTASASATVTSVTTPQPSLNPATRCNGETTPLTLDPGINNPAYAYQWYDNSGTAITGATSSTYTVPQPFVTGSYNYSVTITNTQNGISCPGSASMTFTVNASASVNSMTNQTICEGASATFTATSPNTSPSFQWLGPDSFSSTSSTITINNATTANGGTYMVTVTDAGGCTGTGSVDLAINAAPDISINDSSDHFHMEVCREDPFPVLVASSSVAGTTFMWTLPDGTNPTSASITVPSGGYGVYEVIATDPIGCTSESHVEIIEEPCEIIPHNVFTPNGDGDNEYFHIDNIDTHPSNNVQIYNRWGNKVYDESGYNNSSVKFEGTDLPDGTYYYVITAPDITKQVNGTVTKISEQKK